ncbi:glycosyltransferase family 2 protein [Rhizobium sp. BK661]|uniref:glycosyltransferase family 2 protein n=1 Tax=Rhizobium sp. BK661 TaxID=2586991 RepID=UPI0021695CBC|nr:glycosyltransferase family 2 protein [Rhizobium sp. BK661]MCS3744336.1 GT2 family glycosyltransferase [Rhizobium sp. BK661]
MVINIELARAVFKALPNFLKLPLLYARRWILRSRQGVFVSRVNTRAFNTLMRHGSEWDALPSAMLALFDDNRLPDVDISAVTYNSQKWLSDFSDALNALDYPKDKLHVRFVDNASTDETCLRIREVISRLSKVGIDACLIEQQNLGFGGGHNTGVRAGRSDFILVTNVDLTFEPSSLRRLVSHAVADTSKAAAWEMRQKPYEHPKVYEPLTGATNWNSHACVLFRRSAFEEIGGYCDDLFMYGEDVELSYRLRANGFVLRYNPHAVVYHHTYKAAAEVKPIQYIGSTFANLYIRLRYGGFLDILLVAPLAAVLLILRPRFTTARMQHLRTLAKLLRKAPKALWYNISHRTNAPFPFAFFDYDVARRGAFHEAGPLPSVMPKVSIITRSYKGREALLLQAMRSVANQTYPNIEHLISEDRGDTLGPAVMDFARRTGRDVIYVTGNKTGRSDAANLALARATGHYCIFLDDDDQFYCDHVETLISAALANEGARGAYSLAFDIPSQRLSDRGADFKVELPITHQFMASPLDPEALKTRNYLPIQAVLFERGLYEERGGFDEDLDMLEDWALWQKYTHRAEFVFVPKTTSLYRTPLRALDEAERMKALNTYDTIIQNRMNAWRAAWDEKYG